MMMSAKQDFYQVLGISRAADCVEVKRAYRKLALSNHPDHNPGDRQAAERFREACEAYAVLSNPVRRAYFDRFGRICGSALDDLAAEADQLFNVLLSCVTGQKSQSKSQSQPRRAGQNPGDLRLILELSFAEAVHGAAKKLSITRRVPCQGCDHTGVRPRAEPRPCGHCGGRGEVRHSRGCLKIEVACPLCHGRGLLLHDPCADCGGTGLSQKSEVVTLNVPPGVTKGQVMRVQGKGETPKGGPPGNLYVVFQVRCEGEGPAAP